MEITKIEIDDACDKAYRHQGYQDLKVVILTVKTRFLLFFSKTKTLKAFPLNTYFPNKEGKILYFYYSDSDGKCLGDIVSKQINNFFLIKRFK